VLSGWPVRWGSEAQATHHREGEAGHNVSLEGTMGDTQRSPTIPSFIQGGYKDIFSLGIP